MKNYITNLSAKATPLLERTLKWVVRTAFQLLQLMGLAFTVMHLITAVVIVEAVVAGITVFASVYFSKYLR